MEHRGTRRTRCHRPARQLCGSEPTSLVHYASLVAGEPHRKRVGAARDRVSAFFPIVSLLEMEAAKRSPRSVIFLLLGSNPIY